ncbi:MAG: ABC transporter ATP-binding protein/permease [Lachnospiraceae bacterium]|nr:ABC transporter ATP-binding protein/permease [Lachnospiraceae bacterium]
MTRILKYMKEYGAMIALVIALLFVQAFCDLALPQYTSDIIDTGIQNKGIEHVMPEKIVPEEFEYAKLFMKEDEQNKWDKSYTKKNNVYKRNKFSEDELDEYDSLFAMPLITNSQMSQVPKDEFKKQLAEQMNVKPEDVTDEMIDGFAAKIGWKVNYNKKTEEKDGKKQTTYYVDMRGMFKNLIGSGAMKQENLIDIRDKMEENFKTMEDSFIKSTAISYTISASKMADVDVDKIQTRYLWIAGFKMIVMALLMSGSAVFAGFFASKIGAAVGMNLRGKIFKKVINFSDAEMNKFSTASLITRSTNDIQQIQMVITMLLRMVAYAPIVGIGGVLKVIQTGAGMSWIIVLAVISVLMLVIILMMLAMPKFKVMQKLVDKVNLVSREILTGLLVIRAFGREKTEEERFDDANKNLTKAMLFTNRVMSVMMPGMMLIMNGISILIVWVAAGRIDTGSMQVGTMTAFITYTMQIIMAFLMLTMMSVMLPRAAVSAERIEEVLNKEITIYDDKDAEVLGRKDNTVVFNDVSFKYPGAEDNVLEHISFTAEPGKTTAIIGSTGSGKSTLINLIPRFYDVSEGSITVGGKDIRNVSIESLRDLIGYVPQKAVLFSGTIASNLRYGRSDATDDEIIEAAQISQSEEFIEGKKAKYDTHISQGGTNVSGGQKQRLSIARAIAKKPEIYIFDDSFSALDFKTDAVLRKALSKKTKNSTVIIVAQRISTILNADQIIVLDGGKIAGIGTHKDLLDNCEVYRQIAKSQLSEAELGISEDNGKEGK